MKIVLLMLPADLKNMNSRKKTVIVTILRKKITKKVCIPFKICRTKAFGQIVLKKFLLKKLVLAENDTFTKGFTNALLRRFCCLFVSCL